MSDFGTIVQIGDILVSEDVVLEYFSCDYAKCRGRCCIEGDCGAPLEEYEPELIEREYDTFSPLMQESGRKTVGEKGFFELDFEGDIVTPVIPGRQDCAYTHWDESGNCLCAIEKCFFEGGCTFRKPRSCRLYPIRVTRLSSGGLALNLHRWDICKDAFEKGRREGTRVYQFLRGPLEDLFGEEFYRDLCAAAEYVIESVEENEKHLPKQV